MKYFLLYIPKYTQKLYNDVTMLTSKYFFFFCSDNASYNLENLFKFNVDENNNDVAKFLGGTAK